MSTLPFMAKLPRKLLCIPNAIYTLPKWVMPTTGVLAFISLFVPGKTLAILLLVDVASTALLTQEEILVIVFPVCLIRVVVVVPLLCRVLPPVTLHRECVVPLAVATVLNRVPVLLCPRVDTMFRLKSWPIWPHDPLVTLILVPVPRYTLQVVRSRLRWAFCRVPLPKVRVVRLVVRVRESPVPILGVLRTVSALLVPIPLFLPI